MQILEDDRHDQPVYAPVPMIREPVLKAYPQIAAIVKPLMESFTRETLQELNARVQINGEAEEAVAELRDHRVIQPPAPDWLEQVVGSFQDEPAFEEVLAYGRAIRKGEL